MGFERAGWPHPEDPPFDSIAPLSCQDIFSLLEDLGVGLSRVFSMTYFVHTLPR